MNSSLLFTDIRQVGLSDEITDKLRYHGIMSVAQCYELVCQQPSSCEWKTMSLEIKAYLESRFPALTIKPVTFLPEQTYSIKGIAGPPSSNQGLCQRREVLAENRHNLQTDLLTQQKQVKLPSQVLLTRLLPSVYDQGQYGYCVGFGSTVSREFLATQFLSPGYGYRGAKARDGMPEVEGSWQVFAFEHYFLTGHVSSARYSYQDAIDGRSIARLSHDAKHYKTAGFVDLLLDKEMTHALPWLIKAVLSGHLLPELGPRPVSVSLALYDSIQSTTTRRTGMFTMPLPNEQCLGGHAMCIVGYLEAHDPNGLFDTNWFIVRNSWSDAWAAENPLGLPGYALIPEDYFTHQEYVWELLMCVAEQSPALRKGWLQKAIRSLNILF